MNTTQGTKFGVRGKFISIISMVILVILSIIAFGSITLTDGFLSLQADTFINQLRQEQTREEQILHDGLQAKGKLLADMLVDSSTELLLNYDFEPLVPLAANAQKDPDIDSVIFTDGEGKQLTPGAKVSEGAEILTREIEFNDEILGRVEIALNFNAVHKAVTALSGRIGTLVEETATGQVEAKRVVFNRILFFSVGGLFLLCLIVYVLFTRIIVHPLRADIGLAGEIRDGDLSRRLKSSSRDELGELARALDAMADGLTEKVNLAEIIASGDLTAEVVLASDRDQFGLSLQHMVARLSSMVGNIQATSEQIASGSNQIADTSQSLSQGATESASSIEEISSSMTQLASQTQQNAENAAQANRFSAAAKAAAEKGNQQMQAMVTAMGEINESGHNISKIIKVIDEIAFQTNLLALNAAVEAARAGQHGKGFAVVAEEVRNLAARSAKAARETSELIEGSVKKAETGAQLADKTAEALGEIVVGVNKVSDLVAEIAAASNEQAEGISQVNIGLGQIDQVTQQNTANAEESAASAEELSSQAAHLRQMLTRFKLKNIGGDFVDSFADEEEMPAPAIGWAGDPPPSASFASDPRSPRSHINLDDDDF